MSQRVQQFDAAVKQLVVPALTDKGFTSNNRRRIFRRTTGDYRCHFVQIIQLQIGTKSRSGRFTANLGVFSPEFNHGVQERFISAPEVPDCFIEMTKRLGFLFDPPQNLLGRILGLKLSEPFDYWWALDESHEIT